MRTSPRAHARIASMASRGRGSEGCSDSKRYRTCSAHNAAQRARRRWSEAVSVPPRRMVTSRRSRAFGRITSWTVPAVHLPVAGARDPGGRYRSAMRVVVLGAGFGGLELTTKLSEEFGDDADVVLIDREGGFIFGFSKLDVMFGRTVPEAVFHPYADFVKPGVRLVKAEITSIDPVTKRVETTAGPFEADVLVVALGADLHPEATPGLVEGGYEFYTPAAAFALREVLAGFEGGRVIVAVTSTPFKCPPAPSETALLM